MNDNRHVGAICGPTSGLRCRCCGEPIGVYEPLIAIERERVRGTSRAAEPALATTPGEYRHLGCHERQGKPAPEAQGDAREHACRVIGHGRRTVLSDDRDLSR